MNETSEHEEPHLRTWRWGFHVLDHRPEPGLPAQPSTGPASCDGPRPRRVFGPARLGFYRHTAQVYDGIVATIVILILHAMSQERGSGSGSPPEALREPGNIGALVSFEGGARERRHLTMQRLYDHEERVAEEFGRLAQYTGNNADLSLAESELRRVVNNYSYLVLEAAGIPENEYFSFVRERNEIQES